MYLNEISLGQSEITFDLSEILFYQSEKTFGPREIIFDQSEKTFGPCGIIFYQSENCLIKVKKKKHLIQMKYYLITVNYLIKIDPNEIEIFLIGTEFYALFIGNLIYVYVKENSEIQFPTN